MAYEVDLFGRVRRDIEAARYDADAVAAAYDAARVLVVADTARAYLNACAYGESEQVARASIALAQRNLDLISEQERAGSASRLDAERAWRWRAPRRRWRPSSAAQRRLVRTGGAAGPHAGPGAAGRASMRQPAGAGRRDPGGRRRRVAAQAARSAPAERRLAADTARIGVAVADLYPRVTLGASGSYLRNDTLTGDRAWSFALGPLVSWSFPNIAAARRIEQAEAQSAASLARFDGAVLNALKETEQALSAYDAAIRQRDALVQARTRADNAFRGGATLPRRFDQLSGCAGGAREPGHGDVAGGCPEAAGGSARVDVFRSWAAAGSRTS